MGTRPVRTVLHGASPFSALSIAAVLSVTAVGSAGDATAGTRRHIEELKPTAVIRVGRTADWVATGDGAVWVASTGPDAVSQIDPRTNTLIATVPLPGNPCAGLALGARALWIPLCAKPNTLARVDLHTHRVTLVKGIGPADREGGITTSPDGVWLIVDRSGTLARIDPASNHVRQIIHVPPGSYNPLYSAGQIWVTQADGAAVTVVNAATGAISTTLRSGPGPRFLTSGAGAVWTLNQGDGSLTRIDTRTMRVIQTIALDTPGHGGDIKFGGGMVWSTMPGIPLTVVDGKTGRVLCQWAGPGGDSLGIDHRTIWLTNYEAGTISRLEMGDALRHCRGGDGPRPGFIR